MSKLIKPKRISPGDTIGVISPAGPVRNKELWSKAICVFEQKGYKIKISDNADNIKGYLAGDDQQRAKDLMDFFLDDEIKAIICSRGGYGALRIIEHIDPQIIRSNPKIFVGYSDITVLHSLFNKIAGIVSFHGPLFLSDFGNDENDKFTIDNFFEILQTDAFCYEYKNPYEYTCINPGQTTAELAGGNLAVLCSLMGTKYFPDLNNKILIIEDVAEPVYKIDRMLTQLKLSGVLNNLSGILFGEFTECKSKYQDLLDLLTEKTKDLNIPVGYGFPCGHGKSKMTLPLGIKCYFDSENFKLSIQEQIYI